MTIPHSSSMDITGNNPFTFSAFVKLDSYLFPYALFHTGIDGDPENSIRFSIGTNEIAIHWEYGGGTNYELTSNIDIPIGEWVYLSIVWDGNVLSVYKNSNLVVQDSPPNGPGETADRVYYIGSQGGSDALDGRIDYVSYWNIALTPQGIQSQMINPISGDEQGLIGYWAFDEGEGSIVTDLSGNGNHGTISGANWESRNSNSENLIDINPGSYFVRVASTAAPISDFSDNAITITDEANTPYIRVVSPVDGETWVRGHSRQYTIVFEKENITGDVGIHLYKDGNEVYTIVSNYNVNSLHSYTWDLNNDVPDGNGYRIKVYSHETGAYDISDGAFTINNNASQPYLHLDTPNGGEVLQIGTEHTISFSNADTWSESLTDEFSLQLWNGDGTYHSDIEGNITLGSRIYNWLIPEVAPGSYFVRVASTQTAISDFSDNVFIDPTDQIKPTVELNPLPDIIGTNDNLLLSWVATDNESMLDIAEIYFSLSSSDSAVQVGSVEAESGSFEFPIPDSTLSNSASVIVKVFDDWGNFSKDTSNLFSIYDNTDPLIAFTDPMQNFEIEQNEQFSLTWSHSDNINVHSHLFEYSSDGSNYDTIIFT